MQPQTANASDTDWWENLKRIRAELEKVKGERDKFKAERDKLQKESAEQRAYFDGLSNHNQTLGDSDRRQKAKIEEQATMIKDLEAKNEKLVNENKDRARAMQDILDGGALPPSPKSTGSRVSSLSANGTVPPPSTAAATKTSTATATATTPTPAPLHRSKSKSRPRKDDDREREKERDRERDSREERKREKERERERAERADRDRAEKERERERERRIDDKRERELAKEDKKRQKALTKIQQEYDLEHRLRGRFDPRSSDDDQTSNGSSDRRNNLKRHAAQSSYVEPWGPVSPQMTQFEDVAFTAQSPPQYGNVTHSSSHASHTSPRYTSHGTGYPASFAPPISTAPSVVPAPAPYPPTSDYPTESRYREPPRRR